MPFLSAESAAALARLARAARRGRPRSRRSSGSAASARSSPPSRPTRPHWRRCARRSTPARPGTRWRMPPASAPRPRSTGGRATTTRSPSARRRAGGASSDRPSSVPTDLPGESVAEAAKRLGVTRAGDLPAREPRAARGAHGRAARRAQVQAGVRPRGRARAGAAVDTAAAVPRSRRLTRDA